MYTFMYVISGRLWPPPADFLLNTERYYTGQLIVLIFFYTGLWSVKLSFLIFFRRLGQNIDKQKYLWWPVLFFTLATYFVCIGDIPYKCLVGSLDEIVVKCSPGENIKFTLDTLKVNCSLDVLSDFLSKFCPTPVYSLAFLLMPTSYDYTHNLDMECSDTLGEEIGLNGHLLACPRYYGHLNRSSSGQQWSHNIFHRSGDRYQWSYQATRYFVALSLEQH